MERLSLSAVNSYLAGRQHLMPASPSRETPPVAGDVVQVTRDIVALHATVPTGPYLSLWARLPGFRREALDEALYKRRSLVRLLCMRTTLHAVPSDELPFFFQAYVDLPLPSELRDPASLLVLAGLCGEEDAGAMLQDLQARVLAFLAGQGPATVRQLSGAVPEFKAKVRYSTGRSYEGEFSVGSRLVPTLCARGLLVRAHVRGTWRSNLYEYAALSDWLPDVDLGPVSPRAARTWLVRCYLAAFGPTNFDDVCWWTGLTGGRAREALEPLAPEVVEVAIEGLGDGYLMLAADAQSLRDVTAPETPLVSFLPSLDPYIMGYGDRRRFLAPEHQAKVFDRAGNAMPTVWAGGRVVGAWGQRVDGSVVYGLFEPVQEGVQDLLAAEASRLEAFLDGEYLRPRSHTPFTRALA
jgi:hypothetical protein